MLLVLAAVLLACACACAEPQRNDTADAGAGADADLVLRVPVAPGVALKVLPNVAQADTLDISFDVSPQFTGRGKKKKLKKFLPFLLIPFIAKLMLLPLFFGIIKFIAVKALIMGNLANMLNLFNTLSSGLQGKDSAMAAAHYGYDGGVEYGAWVNS